MLHTETVESATYELLTSLMHDERLSNFILAGGTALALYLGHRKSIDLDLFSPKSFIGSTIGKHLINKYNFVADEIHECDTVKGSINNIKVDALAYIYPLLSDPVISEDGVRLYSLSDIVAMKLSAIANSGTRLKDFVDIAYLSTKFSLSEMLQSYANKYENISIIHPLKGLTFYADINFDVEIELVNDRFKWKKIEKRIKEMIKYENKVFENFPI